MEGDENHIYTERRQDSVKSAEISRANKFDLVSLGNHGKANW